MARTLAADKLRERWPAILNLLADGMSLRTICKIDGMPTRETVRHWLATDEAGDLSAQYARAREWQGETLASECLELADGADPDSSAGVNKARLQVDTRKWMAGKLAPKVYGDRIDVGVSGTVVNTLEVGGMLAQQLGAVAAGAVTPQALGTARVTVDAEVADEGDTEAIDVGEDGGAHDGREADPLDPAGVVGRDT